MPRKPIDITGQKFNRLFVVRQNGYFTSNGRNASPRWECECDCGNTHYARYFDLKNNKVVSCGCYNREQRTKHGMYKTRTYRIWHGVLERCRNPNSSAYSYYGARGIQYAPEWGRFESFLADMGECPSDSHTIDRIDVDGNYCKENCKWATRSEQMQNRRRYKNWNQKLSEEDVRRIKTSGESSKDLAAEFGVSYKHICAIRSGRHFKEI